MIKEKITFVALTSYQLFVSLIYSEAIRDKYYNAYDISIIKVGVDIDVKSKDYNIIEVPNLNKTKIQRVWQRVYWGGLLFPFTKLNKIFKQSNRHFLFVFNDNEPVTNKLIRMTKKNDTNNKVILIEEGIGVYENTIIKQLNLRQKLRVLFTGILGSPMQYKAVGDNEHIDFAIVEKSSIYANLEKARKQRVLVQNKKLIFSHADSFLKVIGYNSTLLKRYDVLFIGQPFNEFGEVVDQEETYLQEIFEITSKYQLRVIIKPHPREDASKYNRHLNEYIAVCDDSVSKLPIECIVSTTGVNLVITFNSSAGVNIGNSNQQIDCLFCYQIQEYKELMRFWSNGYAELNDKIFEANAGNMLIPKTRDEFEQKLLESMRKKKKLISQQAYSNDFEEIDVILSEGVK